MTSVQPNELNSFFSYVINVFEGIGIPYMVVGGFAAIFYGEPRLTIDVDIVVDMQLQHINRFVGMVHNAAKVVNNCRFGMASLCGWQCFNPTLILPSLGRRLLTSARCCLHFEQIRASVNSPFP